MVSESLNGIVLLHIQQKTIFDETVINPYASQSRWLNFINFVFVRNCM